MEFDHLKYEIARRRLLNPLLLKLYLLKSLPAAWFVGLKLKSLSEQEAVVALRYSWWSSNPFGSIYFAALLAAGEFSSGIIAAALLRGYKQRISMLVSGVEADFRKKAKGICTFTCTDGVALQSCIQKAVESGLAQSITCTTTAKNELGEIVAEIRISWTFKVKQI